MKTVTIDHFASLLDFQQSLPSDKLFCFRGQSDASWELVPSMYHGLQSFKPPPDNLDDGSWIEEIERDTYREFDRCCRSFTDDKWDFNNQWHQLFLAQHYGVPTRLLDWTRHLFVATYFASTSNLDKDAALWCLNVSDFPHPAQLGRLGPGRGHRLTALDHCVVRSDLKFFTPLSKAIIASDKLIPESGVIALPSDQSGDNELSGFLVILEPPFLEDRMKNQASLFTLYVTYGDYELVWNHADYIQRVERNRSIDLLTKIIIPHSAKNDLRQALMRNGIDPYHIFPDLAGLVMLLSQDRKQRFSFYTEERKKWS